MASNQKLATERANIENKIKMLEEQVTLNDDNIAKVSTSYSTAVQSCVCVISCILVCVYLSIYLPTYLPTYLPIHPPTHLQ